MLRYHYMTTFTIGPAASHTYITDRRGEFQLTLDWSYDKVYFKDPDSPWHTLALDPNRDDLESVRQHQGIDTFKTLIGATVAHPRLVNSPYPEIATAVNQLREISGKLT